MNQRLFPTGPTFQTLGSRDGGGDRATLAFGKRCVCVHAAKRRNEAHSRERSVEDGPGQDGRRHGMAMYATASSSTDVGFEQRDGFVPARE